jgi:hypothetical protein
MLILAIIFIVLLITVLFLFRKRMIIFMWFFLIIFIICMSFKIIKGYIPVPIGIRHFVHLLIPPNDLYRPIISDNFLFYEKGFNKTYPLEPKYLDFYDCGFTTDYEIQPDYKFNGKIKFEFFWKNKQLFERTVTRPKTFSKKEVSLIHFEIPFLGKYKKDISMKVTVLEPDIVLKDKKSIKLYIAVSGTP